MKVIRGYLDLIESHCFKYLVLGNEVVMQKSRVDFEYNCQCKQAAEVSVSLTAAKNGLRD